MDGTATVTCSTARPASRASPKLNQLCQGCTVEDHRGHSLIGKESILLDRLRDLKKEFDVDVSPFTVIPFIFFLQGVL